MSQEDISASVASGATDRVAVSEKSTSNSTDSTASGLPEHTRSPETFFCADGMGWAFYPGRNIGLPELYETRDGGRTWTQAEVLLPQGMDGASCFIVSLMETQDEVMFVLQVKHKPPLANDIFYEFILDEATGIWHWNVPVAVSRMGENALEFYNYMTSQTQYFPADFTAKTGLYDWVTMQKLVYDAAAWKAEREHSEPPIFVSYEEANQLGAALYAVADFDVVVLKEADDTWFQLTEGGWLVSFEEYIGDGWETLVEDVQINQDGTIQATTLTVFGSPDSAMSLSPILRKSILRTDKYEGKLIFTLLENQQYAYNEKNWPTPHWLWNTAK